MKRAGACSASPQPRILAIKVKLYFLAASAETRTRAEAPSDKGEEFGAVTVPFLGWKAGRTARSFSSFVGNVAFVCLVETLSRSVA